MTNNKIVIFGGSGFIGTKLTEHLLDCNYNVTVVDLNLLKFSHPNLQVIKRDLIQDAIDTDIVNGSYGIINLAGVTIGKRWNRFYKKRIYDSRIVTTRKIVDAISKAQTKPTVLVNASAIGYYGDQGIQVIDEECSPGDDFLAQLCVDWEEEAQKAQNYGVRVVLIRTANVLGNGGLLSTLYPFFKKGFGGYFGSGQQYMPWIHWKDIIGIYMFALESSIIGACNTGAGSTISQKTLFRVFGKAVNSPFVWRIPYAVARILFGKFADTLVMSQNTESKKIVAAGYKYSFLTIEQALKDLYK